MADLLKNIYNVYMKTYIIIQSQNVNRPTAIKYKYSEGTFKKKKLLLTYLLNLND